LSEQDIGSASEPLYVIKHEKSLPLQITKRKHRPEMAEQLGGIDFAKATRDLRINADVASVLAVKTTETISGYGLTVHVHNVHPKVLIRG
jgi:hypothetical protein